jgi:hypothetical protein
MTGFSSERRRSAVPTLVVLPTVLGVLLAGCNATTYGTGKSPGMQTLQDLTGMSALGQKDEPIDYRPRPKVVAPPNVASLPPPGSDTQQNAANWPNDPDKLKAKVIADADARAASGNNVPYKFSKGTVTTDQLHVAPAGTGKMSKEDIAKARAAFVAAKGNVVFDANGNPVRQYLTDPPSEYRVPDPTAPLEADADALKKKKKKKFKWWWQQ